MVRVQSGVAARSYGSMEAGGIRPSSRSLELASAIAVTGALSVLCVVGLLATETSQSVTVSTAECGETLEARKGYRVTGRHVQRKWRGRETALAQHVLDDGVQDPMMQRQLNFGSDEPAYEWSDTNGDDYDPEKSNVFAEPGFFDPPSVGHAEKSLANSPPHEPEANVLDYLPSGPFTESKSMELRQVEGPPDPEENPVDDMPLDE